MKSMTTTCKKIWYAPNCFEAYGEEEIEAVEQCLREGWLAGFGKRSIEFETKVAKIFGKQYGVFVNSGSSACLLALASLDLPKGSEIITAACTFSTTIAPMVQLGYVPVFCDVGLTTYVPTVESIIQKVSSQTKVIMTPNLIGNKPDWETLRNVLNDMGREDIYLIEDSADTITHTLASDISTTSFYASHIITAGGAGGMVMFNTQPHRDRCLSYRDWGRTGNNSEDMSERFNYKVDNIKYDFKFLYNCLGYNFKSSEMNAAFGLAQLTKFDKFKTIRRQNIERYIDNLQDVNEIILPNDSLKPNWLAIPLQTKQRFELLTFLEKNGIQTRVTFAGNITRHPAYRQYLENFFNSDLIMERGFLLGSHQGMSIEDVDYVCNKIKEFFNA